MYPYHPLARVLKNAGDAFLAAAESFRDTLVLYLLAEGYSVSYDGSTEPYYWLRKGGEVLAVGEEAIVAYLFEVLKGDDYVPTQALVNLHPEGALHGLAGEMAWAAERAAKAAARVEEGQ